MKNWKDGRNIIYVKCENCKKTFEKVESEYNRSNKNGRKHFCSLECSQQYRKLKMRKCLQCNLDFIPKKKNNKFCSHSCSAKYNNKKKKGIKYNLSEEGLVSLRKSANKNLKNNYTIKKENYYKNPKKCKYCSQIIPYNKNQIFCNIKCKHNYNKKNLPKYQIYYRKCLFEFSLNEYPDEFNFNLIEKYGWYSPTNKKNNINGVSRDHIYSINEGFKNNIPPEIIKHPANCQLLVHSKNISKNKKSEISINKLKNKIKEWNEKYNN